MHDILLLNLRCRIPSRLLSQNLLSMCRILLPLTIAWEIVIILLILIFIAVLTVGLFLLNKRAAFFILTKEVLIDRLVIGVDIRLLRCLTLGCLSLHYSSLGGFKLALKALELSDAAHWLLHAHGRSAVMLRLLLYLVFCGLLNRQFRMALITFIFL